MSTPARPPRLFVAEDLLSGSVSLDGYPFRYICVRPSRGAAMTAGLGATGANNTLDVVLSAVEMLESRGWELVHVDTTSMIALVRR